jgi:hypothetical protein
MNRDSILVNAASAARGHANERATTITVKAASNPIRERPVVAGTWEVESIEEL